MIHALMNPTSPVNNNNRTTLHTVHYFICTESTTCIYSAAFYVFIIICSCTYSSMTVRTTFLVIVVCTSPQLYTVSKKTCAVPHKLTLILSKFCTVSRTTALNLLSQSREFILILSYNLIHLFVTPKHEPKRRDNNVNKDANDETYQA